MFSNENVSMDSNKDSLVFTQSKKAEEMNKDITQWIYNK